VDCFQISIGLSMVKWISELKYLFFTFVDKLATTWAGETINGFADEITRLVESS
jgi:hypothetical protein